jgi:cytochrome c5
MRFAADCLVVEPKNYHAWAHRQAVLLAAAGAATAAGSSAALPEEAAPAELRSADSTAERGGSSGDDGREGDGKCSSCWAAELDYVDSCIGADVRDNSAWAQRFFLLRNRCALACKLIAAASHLSTHHRCSTHCVHNGHRILDNRKYGLSGAGSFS